LLLALTLPPFVPWWMAALGSAFAILVAKTMFGGLGFNLFNPALAGRAFMLATFPLAMTSGWGSPRSGFGATLDAVTTATPLAALKEHGLAEAMRLVSGPDYWSGLLLGFRPGSLGEVSAVLIALRAVAGPGNSWSGLMLGFRPGSIGEVSVLLIALGAGVLMMRGLIGLTIPLSVIAGVGLSTAFTGATLLHLLSGGLWLGAFYMATDYVTSPSTRPGRIVFGLTIGALTGAIRMFGGYPEGICYAILIANTLVPALNLWFRPRRVGLAESPS
jgi:electron transport complex protein RnfD